MTVTKANGMDGPGASDSSMKLPDDAGSLRELARVAIPLVLSSGSLSLMNVIDRLLLTWHSTDALAAAMPAGLLHWTIASIAIGTVMYVNTFVAQFEGAGRRDQVVTVVMQGVWLGVVSGAMLMIFAPLSTFIFRLIGHHPDLQTLESQYFSTLSWGSIPVVLACAMSTFYSGRGQTMVVMWVNAIGVLINGVLDYVLIFGVGPFPEMGIQGAAVATVIARASAVVFYAVLMLWGGTAREYDFHAAIRWNRELVARVLRFGVPSGLQFFVDIAGFSVFIFLIGGIGKSELAATSLAFNLNSLAFIPLIGVGTAVMTLVGNRIGEGRPHLAIRTTWLAFAASGSWMMMFIVVFLMMPDVLLIPYARYSSVGNFDAIRETVILLLRFVCTYSFFDAMAIVFSSAVRGAGDTRFSLVYTAVCCWSLMVIPTWLASRYAGGNLMLSWTACTVYIVVVGVGFMLRFQAGRWQSMRVIESVPASDLATSRA